MRQRYDACKRLIEHRARSRVDLPGIGARQWSDRGLRRRWLALRRSGEQRLKIGELGQKMPSMSAGSGRMPDRQISRRAIDGEHYALASRYASASSAAMQPVPALVTACR